MENNQDTTLVPDDIYNSLYGDKNGLEGIDYQPERNTISDIGSSLWKGTGSALDVYGTGLDSEWMQSFGKYILGTSYAKPDESQYLGTNSETNKVLTGAAESLPTSSVISLGTLGGAALGSVAGPAGTYVGGAAGMAATGTVLWKGLYSKAFDEIVAKDPNVTQEEADKYASISATIEAGTEGVGVLADIATAKFGGKLAKEALKDALRLDLFSAKEAVGSIAKRGTIPELAAKVAASAGMEGSEEVLADYAHYKEDTSYNLNPEKPDYFRTFLIGAIAGLPTIAAANVIEQKSQNRIATNLEKGLTSEDIDQRQYTSDQIFEQLAKASPEAAERWKTYSEVYIDRGPLDLKSPILEDITKEAEWKKKYNSTIYTQVTEDPTSILKEAGIPVSSPYGNAKAPEIDPRMPLNAGLTNAPIGSPSDGTQSSVAPINTVSPSPEAVRQLEARNAITTQIRELPEDSNNVATPVETIAQPVPIAANETKKAEVLSKIQSIPIAATEPQWKSDPETVRKINAQRAIDEGMSQIPEDSNTIPVATEEKLPTTLKERKIAIAARKLNEDKKVASAITKRVEEALKPIQEKLKSKVVETTLPIVEEKAATVAPTTESIKENKVVVEQAPIVPEGPTSTVDKTGKLNKVIYDRNSWEKASLGGNTFYKNNNAIIIGSGREWTAVQRGTKNERIPLGKFDSLKGAISALAGEDVQEKETKTAGRKKAELPKLTPEQSSLINDDLIDKVQRTVLKNKEYSTLRDDSEVKSVITESIVRAASQFNPEKGSAFATYAVNKGKGAVLDYLKTKGEFLQFTESDTTNEGSVTEGGISQVTKEDTEKPIINVEKKAPQPVAASEVKIIDPNSVYSVEEQKAILDRMNKAKEKGKTVDTVKKYQEDTTDEAVSVEDKTPIDLTDDPEADITNEADIKDTANKILDRVGYDVSRAKGLAESIGNESLKEEVIKYLSELKSSTVGALLLSIKNSKSGIDKSHLELANLFSTLISKANRNNVKVLLDPTARSGFYSINKDKITLTNSNVGTALHEVSHSLTSIALHTNKALAQNVRDVIAEIETSVSNNPDVDVTKEDIVAMREATPNSTSQEFKKWANSNGIKGSKRAILYSLLNEHEFLAQFVDSKAVQSAFSNVELSAKVYASPFKTAYNWLVDTYLKIVGATRVKRNAMAKALNLISEISQLDISEYTSNQDINIESNQSEADVEPKRTFEEQVEILQSNDTKGKPVDIARSYFEKFKDTVKDYGSIVTEELRKINPKLLRFLRRFEYEMSKYNVEYHDKVKPFIESYRKLKRVDQLSLDHLLRNGDSPEDIERVKKILKTNKMEDSYARVKEVLADIYKRKEHVGLNEYGTVAEYFPRRVQDMTGLMQAMKEDPHYGVISAEMDRVGGNRADKEKAIMQMINTGRSPAYALLKPGSSKERSIAKVSSAWNQYYKNSIDSLIDHIYESNEAIEARNMFGDVKRRQTVSERNKLMEDLYGENKKNYSKEVFDKKVGEVQILNDYLADYQREWRDGISNVLYKEGMLSLDKENYSTLTDEQKSKLLTAQQQEKIIQLIRARLTQKGMNGLLATARNLSLISSLGSITSSITQLTDTVFSANDNGVKNTIKAMFGDNEVSTKDLDLSNSMREFQSTGSARLLDQVLRKVGLVGLDLFGKNTYMNAAVLKVKEEAVINPSRAKADFIKKWSDSFGDKTEETFNDIVEGKKNDNTKFFAFTALSEVQPTSLSETPLKYLTSGNGRIFYVLKTYSIKQMNTIYKRLVTDSKNATTKADRLSALASAGKLILLMTLAGASADELKDFILGRDVEFSDHVGSSLLKIVMLNKFTLETGAKGDMFKSILADTLLPPTRVISDPYADIANLFSADPNTIKSLRNLPMGNILYSRYTDTGRKTNFVGLKKSITDRYSSSGSIGSVREDMIKYNQWAKGAGEPLISYQSLRNSRKKKEDKEKGIVKSR